MLPRTILSLLALFSVLILGACTVVPNTIITGTISRERVPLSPINYSSGLVAPDDIVNTPGAATYRANVHEQGVPDRWPAIATVETRLAAGSGAVFVRYRAEITTKAGDIRNNILTIRKESGHFETDDNLADVELYTIGAPADLTFYRSSAGGCRGHSPLFCRSSCLRACRKGGMISLSISKSKARIMARCRVRWWCSRNWILSCRVCLK